MQFVTKDLALLKAPFVDHQHLVDASPPGVVATLDPTDADDLEHFAPEADGRTVEGLLVCIDAWALPNKIGIVWPDQSCALEELPTAEGNDSYFRLASIKRTVVARALTENEHGVVNEEVFHTPWPERDVAVEQNDEDHPSKTDIRLLDR